MCRHVPCERRSRSWCQGPGLPGQLQFQQSEGPARAVGPTPGSLSVWLEAAGRRWFQGWQPDRMAFLVHQILRFENASVT